MQWEDYLVSKGILQHCLSIDKLKNFVLNHIDSMRYQLKHLIVVIYMVMSTDSVFHR